MAATWEVPGGQAHIEVEDDATWEVPGEAAVIEPTAVVGAVAPTAVLYGSLVGPMGGPI